MRIIIRILIFLIKIHILFLNKQIFLQLHYMETKENKTKTDLAWIAPIMSSLSAQSR